MSSDNVATLPGVETFPRRSKFRLEDFDTLQPSRLHWRVKGLWPAVGVCFIGGPSMSGKSFLALDWLARVCLGRPILGRKASACAAVYIAAEAAAGVRNRIAGLRERTGPMNGAFQLIGQQPNLADPDDVADLKATLTAYKAQAARDGLVLGVVCVDTLSAAIPGADENSSKDMSPVLSALQALAVDLELLVLVVAHTGKDHERGLRGWSGLLANADGLVMLEDPKGEETRVGRVVKVKDGPAGDEFAFGLEVVEVGHDEDGDPLTTCVVAEAEVPDAAPRAGRKPTKAAESARLIMNAYGRVHDVGRVQIMAPGANGAWGVEVSRLRVQAYEMGLGPTEPDPAAYETDGDRRAARRKWTDQRKADFDRGLSYLIETARTLRVEAGCAWEPRNGSGPGR